MEFIATEQSIASFTTPRFPIGARVEVVTGRHQGGRGTVVGRNRSGGHYEVSLDVAGGLLVVFYGRDDLRPEQAA